MSVERTKPWPIDSQVSWPAVPPGEEILRRRLLEVLLAPAGPSRMTYKEFLMWADEDTLAEWVARSGEDVGEVVMTSPASRRHQEMSFFLGQVIGLYVEQRGLGRVLLPPFQIKLSHSGREPDLLFVAQEHLEQLKETYLDGPADLVVEIVSPESMGRDRGEKFYEYEQAGIPEYWLIDPQMKRAEFYQLVTGDQYQLVLPDAEGIYRSVVLPGFWLRVEWLWQESLPQPLRALGEIADIDAEVVERFLQALGGASDA
ncbi:MAG: Uma2 family endonuclease [Anaerolineae bacterium]|nr:Uma2 family endonuclease [Anaerolineae bacterium]